MRRLIGLLTAVAALAGGAAVAQVSLKPDTPSVMSWTPEQQSDWYRSIETVYKSATVRRGEEVRALPKAAQPLDPGLTYSYAGRSWTVDDYMTAYRVSGLLVMKDGEVLLERYGLGRKPEDRWISFSVTKSVVSTLVGATIQDGKIKSLDEQVTLYIPQLVGSAYEGVTIRQLLTMSSGVKWDENYYNPNADVLRAGARILESGVNPIVGYMRALPREHKPGSTFHYSTGEADLVGVLISNAVGKSLSDYLSEKLWQAYGMERDAVWPVDPSGHERGGCCMAMTLGDYARVGQFILERGLACGRQILPSWWVAEATTPQITDGALPPGYGFLWWVRPGGAYEARGAFGQSITTWRDDKLVIVINSAWPTANRLELVVARSAFLNAVREAVKGM